MLRNQKVQSHLPSCSGIFFRGKLCFSQRLSGKASIRTWRESDLLIPKNPCPGDPITLSEDDWGVQSPPQQGIYIGCITILRR